jgi:gamma-glutamyltranspeptidase/glutathione hydrolase
MMPTVVLRGGRPVLALGAAGGSRIISGVFEVILNDLYLFPGDLRRAVFAPRVHDQWVPEDLEVEPGFSARTLEELQAMGHHLAPPPYPTLVQAVQRNDKGELEAVFDPRDEGGAQAL